MGIWEMGSEGELFLWRGVLSPRYLLHMYGSFSRYFLEICGVGRLAYLSTLSFED